MSVLDIATGRSVLAESIGYWSRTSPAAPSLIYAGEAVSYAELAELVEGHEARLTSVTAEDVCGLAIPKSPAGIALVIACLRRGNRFVVSSTQLGDAAREVMFVGAGCTKAITLDGVAECAGDPAAYSAHPPANFVLSTSGSTGQPKVVPLPTASVDAFTRWAATKFSIEAGTKVLSYAPLNFDLSLLDVWSTLSVGGCVVLVTPEQAVRPRQLRQLVCDHDVEVVQAVPLCFSLLAGLDEPAPSVRTAMFTGDVLPAAVLEALPRMFPNARLYNIYGCTETNDSFVFEVDPQAEPATPLPIGTPIAGVEIRVLEGATPGEGELLVSTPFAAAGYLSHDLTIDRFVADPEGSPKTFFRSGDIVSVDSDGHMRLVGRSDSQVKIRGVAVVTKEVESVMRSLEGVNEVAVCVLDDPEWGKKLAAVVEVDDTGSADSLKMRSHCAQLLPRAAIPAQMQFVREPLPRLVNHKIDYAELRRTFALPSLGTDNDRRRSKK